MRGMRLWYKSGKVCVFMNRVLIVSQNHISVYVGGNEIYTHTLATGLARLGYDVVYLSANGVAGFEAEYELRLAPGWKVLGHVFPTADWFRVVDDVRPTIVHATGSGVGITALGAYCRWRKITSVLTFQAPQTGSLVGRIDESIQIRLFDRLIATSPKNAAYLSERTRRPVNTVLLSLKDSFAAVDLIDKKVARRQLHLSQKAIFVLMIAKLDSHHYYKGVEVAFEAIRQLPSQYVLLLAGDGTLMHYYQKLSRDWGLEQRVIFVGFVPDEQQVSYYRAADVVILPSNSESEGFGLVLLEAMACKIPIVTTSCVGIAPLLARRRLARVVPPNDPASLASAITKPLIHQNQIRDALAFARQRSARTMVLETASVYAA